MIRTFSSNLAFRIVLLAALLLAFAFFLQKNDEFCRILAFIALVLAILTARNLFHLVNDTNRRLTRLFESVRYSDFAVRFSSAKEKGASFEEVNRAFNEVLESFRRTRAEKEANLLFLNTVVQQLSTGILAFGADGNLLVSNNAAFQQLDVYRLQNLVDLPEKHALLADFLETLTSKNKLLYQPEPTQQLSVQGVKLNLQGREVRLATLQNIHPELQQKEVDAWKNLARVLRHEIMNSVTPIVSLVETMRQIVGEDLPPSESRSDLAESLEIVSVRSRALMRFVDAYRSFSSVPEPILVEISVKKLVERVISLTSAEPKNAEIRLETQVTPDFLLKIDAGQIEMTLLNLIKNARESIENLPEKRVGQIILSAGIGSNGRPFIDVEDNGSGIETELLEEIFIPFFTTKSTGTGVGLSISRQIMQQHGGDLRLVSGGKLGGARFVLVF
jgi:two-component system, NtrC family, nitrogen regulation sensor histidine kinase NtrY